MRVIKFCFKLLITVITNGSEAMLEMHFISSDVTNVNAIKQHNEPQFHISRKVVATKNSFCPS